MDPWLLGAGGGTILSVSAAALGYAGIRAKGMHRWLGEYIRTRGRRRPYVPGEPIHVFLAVCDHYEPKRGNASPAKAKARVQQWVDEYPKLFDRFRDSLGRPPRHTFFYPEDEYEPELVDMVAGLCRRGYGEVEIHLHHHDDTADGLRNKLLAFKDVLYTRHGVLSTDRETGQVVYGFIHGNWALDNSRADGRMCGVDNELDVLYETGCYADFTLPSAPDEAQTRTINSIYWAEGISGRRKSHDVGRPITEPRPPRGVLLVQGPLLLDWRKRKLAVFPGIENGNLQKSQPPGEKRLGLWIQARVKLPVPKEWVVVKLHTHGVNEPNQDVLLGPAMVELHETLKRLAATDRNFDFSYVTARELANLTYSSLAGVAETSVSDALDYRFQPR